MHSGRVRNTVNETSQTPGTCVVDVLGAGERKSAEELGINGGTELSDPALER